jgi:hypothetical protein
MNFLIQTVSVKILFLIGIIIIAINIISLSHVSCTEEIYDKGENVFECKGNFDCIKRKETQRDPFCWINGKCKKERQFIMYITKGNPIEKLKGRDIERKQEEKEIDGNTVSKSKINEIFDFQSGDRMCVSILANPNTFINYYTDNSNSSSTTTTTTTTTTLHKNNQKIGLRLMMQNLRICSSFKNELFSSSSSSIFVPKTFIKEYDNSNPYSTGCFTEYSNDQDYSKNGFVSKSIISLVKKQKEKFSLEYDENDVSISYGNMATTVCFTINVSTNPDVPIFVQASALLSIENAENNMISSSSSSSSYSSSCSKIKNTYMKEKEYTSGNDDDDNNEEELLSSKTIMDDSKIERKYKRRHRKNKVNAMKHIKRKIDSTYELRLKEKMDECETVESFLLKHYSKRQGRQEIVKYITVTSSDIISILHDHNNRNKNTIPKHRRITKYISQKDSFPYEELQDYEYENSVLQLSGDSDTNSEYYNDGDSSSSSPFTTSLYDIKHYYYYDPSTGHYYYYHPHVSCKWSLHFTNGFGICEDPHIIHDDSVHIFVIFLAIIGIIFGLLFFMLDWKTGALFF